MHKIVNFQIGYSKLSFEMYHTNMIIGMNSGERLFRIMKHLGFNNVTEMAEKIGRHQTTVNGWLSKKRFSNAIRLQLLPFLEKYNINPDFLEREDAPMLQAAAITSEEEKDRRIRELIAENIELHRKYTSLLEKFVDKDQDTSN